MRSSVSRAVSRAARCRGYAAGAASGAPKSPASNAGKSAASGEQTDVVKRVFIDQQRKFRALLEKTKTLTPPIAGDANAIKAYATKKLAILKELDISTPGEKILDTVDGAFAEATTVRGFLDRASELRKALGLKESDETFKVLSQALDATEKSLGTTLMTSNAQGMAKYSAAVAKAAEAAGIKPLDGSAMDKLRAEVDFEAIENDILDLQAVEAEVRKEQA